ncbi:hypothetical protein LAZ67_13001075, partial [Cordylochernes scorpioides]
MALPNDSSLTFYTKATPNQWTYVLSLYNDVLSLKAATRKKKGGPEELIRLDNWYQEQLPKIIRSRKERHITHEELIQITKWKLIRGKHRPSLMDLVRINNEGQVLQITRKAFRRMPNISNAITALTNLKGVGPASASAILAAAYPEQVPYMADESMMATPGVEGTDYTIMEYLNYAEQIKSCSERLSAIDPDNDWNPHKVEMALWTHYLARELKPVLLDDLPAPSYPDNQGEGKENGTQQQQTPADGPDDEDSSQDEPPKKKLH